MLVLGATNRSAGSARDPRADARLARMEGEARETPARSLAARARADARAARCHPAAPRLHRARGGRAVLRVARPAVGWRIAAAAEALRPRPRTRRTPADALAGRWLCRPLRNHCLTRNREDHFPIGQNLLAIFTPNAVPWNLLWASYS